MAGVHPGCFELFATDRVRTVRDLRGKAIAVQAIGSSQHAFTATIVAHVGLDPRRDISWVTHPAPEQMRLLADGKIDAYLSFPPESYELRARGVGRVILNSTLDRPWSRYFCCMVAGHREFVRKHPVAAKRAIRAMLMAAKPRRNRKEPRQARLRSSCRQSGCVTLQWPKAASPPYSARRLRCMEPLLPILPPDIVSLPRSEMLEWDNCS